jgi:hypothetical protein
MTLHIINQASWQETFEALWISALRLLQRVDTTFLLVILLLIYVIFKFHYSEPKGAIVSSYAVLQVFKLN